MITFDGQCVAPQNHQAPSLEAIALSLGRQCRFGGQTRQWYCVLAHSMLVCDIAGVIPDSAPSLSLACLLHDAGEAVCGDIPTPWKTEADRRREDEILGRIYDSLGLSHMWPLTIDLAEAVAKADLLALRAEATLLMPRGIARAKYGAIEPIYPNEQTDDLRLYALRLAKEYIEYCRMPFAWIEQGGAEQAVWVAGIRTLANDVRMTEEGLKS